MAKKALAAFLLVVIAAWAEMTMAPMIAMHAGHMLIGHEMAADMPARKHAGHMHAEHGDVASLPCCPGLHKVAREIFIAIVSGTPACDDPHSCCFRQGPQSVPAPAREVRSLNPQSGLTEAVRVDPVFPQVRRAIDHIAPTPSSPPDVFGMMLRV